MPLILDHSSVANLKVNEQNKLNHFTIIFQNRGCLLEQIHKTICTRLIDLDRVYRLENFQKPAVFVAPPYGIGRYISGPARCFYFLPKLSKLQKNYNKDLTLRTHSFWQRLLATRFCCFNFHVLFFFSLFFLRNFLFNSLRKGCQYTGEILTSSVNCWNKFRILTPFITKF